MARKFYGYSGGDVVAQLSSDGDFEPSTATFDVFTTRTGSTQHTALLDPAGGAITQVTPDANGRILFQGQDTYVGTYWLQDTGTPSNPRWRVEPIDQSEDIAAGGGAGPVAVADITDITVSQVESFLTAATIAAARTAITSGIGASLMTVTDAAALRTAAGAGAVGDDLFTSPTAADARADLGSTTVGDAVYIAASGSAARSAMGAASQTDMDQRIKVTPGGTAFQFGKGPIANRPAPGTPGLEDGALWLETA